MPFPRISHLGAFIKNVVAVPPQSSAAATINGSSIDRTDFGSSSLFVKTGAATGGPTTISITAKIQTSADGSTWADYKPDGLSVATTTLTAASSGVELDVDLAGASQFVRAVLTISFTGGSSPTIPVDATMTLGGSRTIPI